METSWILGVLLLVGIGWVVLHRGGTRPNGAPAGTLEGPGTFEIEVVGESHNQSALEGICGGRSEDDN